MDREKAKIANDKQTKSENYMKNIDELKNYLTDYTPKEKQTVDTPSTQPGTTSRQIPIMISRSLNKLHDMCYEAFYPNSKTDKETSKYKPIMGEITKLYTLLKQYKVVKTAEANNKATLPTQSGTAILPITLSSAEQPAAEIAVIPVAADETAAAAAAEIPVIPVAAETNTMQAQAQAQIDQQASILTSYEKKPPTPLGTSYDISLVTKTGALVKQATVTERKNENDEKYTVTKVDMHIKQIDNDNELGKFMSTYSKDLFEQIADNLSDWTKAFGTFKPFFTKVDHKRDNGEFVKGVVFGRTMLRKGDYLYVFQYSDKNLRLLMYVGERINHESVSLGYGLPLPDITEEKINIKKRIDELLNNDTNLQMIADNFAMKKEDLKSKIKEITEDNYFLETK